MGDGRREVCGFTTLRDAATMWQKVSLCTLCARCERRVDTIASTREAGIQRQLCLPWLSQHAVSKRQRAVMNGDLLILLSHARWCRSLFNTLE